jgi:hypothetical protein
METGSVRGTPYFIYQWTLRSEPERGSECDAKVVISSIIEIHLIAGFYAESNRSEESLDAAARIDRKMGRAAAKLIECIVERVSGNGCGAGVAEFGEAHLPCNERSKWPASAELEFRPEQTSDGACPAHDCGAGDTGGRPVVGNRRVVLFEVVVHFCFKCDIRVDVETDTAPEPEEVDAASALGLHAEEVPIDANFAVVIGIAA